MSAQHPRITGKGLTYDDVLLFPAFSEIMQPEEDLSAPFCRNINQKIPDVSEGVGISVHGILMHSDMPELSVKPGQEYLKAILTL